MSWILELIRTLWPIAAVLTPLIIGAGILWMRSQFSTKLDIQNMEGRILERIESHDGRLNDGSKKLADLDKRVALVEGDCESSPSRHDLNQAIAVLAGRMSAVESSSRGLEREIRTQNDYVHTLIEKGMRG